MKKFNVTGTCYPDKHYMVDLNWRLQKIKSLVDEGNYFTINRARQYGKTTILHALAEYIKDDCIVVQMDFQRLGVASFERENVFVKAFFKSFWKAAARNSDWKIPKTDPVYQNLSEAGTLYELFEELSILCEMAEKPIVLMIDEVDSASNNQIFLDFLGQLRSYYLDRRNSPTFQSVILAGVYDVKNLKRKLRPDEEHKYNSPWNIAADFNVDMNFSVEDISGMLLEYEKEHQTGMDVMEIAQMIYDYTSGYPYLVSRLCQLLDGKSTPEEKTSWTKAGILEAVKLLLKESNTLYDDIRKKITDYPDLRKTLYVMLFNGIVFPYHEQNAVFSIGVMFGFVKEKDGHVEIANRIFEIWFYNLFISEDALNNEIYNAGLQMKNQFIRNGILDMKLVLQKFMEHFTDIYSSSSDTFLEENGRRFFLLYLKPIINGVGNYYIESRTRDMGRTDVIVDYLGRQYVIELKIWHGNEYHQRGEKQLLEYLDAYHLKKGYMISFNFNKNKQVGMKEIHLQDKILVEAVV